MRKKCKLFGVFLLIIAIVVLQLPVSEVAAATSEFVISENGTLTKYVGTSKNVVIPGYVKTVATDAFKDNTKLESITIPNSVEKIEEYAFWGCTSLSSISIGTGLKRIDDFAFANCKGLKTLVLPKNIKHIGIYSFQDCVNFTDITIPPETMDIHESAFDGCVKLVIHAPEGSYPYNYAKTFYIRQKLMKEYEDVPNFDGTIIPGGTTTDVSGNGSAGNGEDRKDPFHFDGEIVTMPDGTIRVISNGSYKDDSLGKVHVVGNRAVVFMDNASPKVIHGNQLPNYGLDALDGQLQEGGKNYPNLTGTTRLIPKYTIVDEEIVADQAYYCNSELDAIQLPGTIREVGQFAFARSTITAVYMSEGVEKIGYGAFYHCDNLSEVTLPATVTTVEPQAFENTALVKNFQNASEADRSLEGDYLIRSGVLLSYRGNAETVVLPETVRVIAGGVFENHSEIVSVMLPEQLQIIGENAFAGCSNLTSLELGEGTLQIKDYAFAGTKLSEVRLPSSVVSLGLGAFDEPVNIVLDGDAPAFTTESSAHRLSSIVTANTPKAEEKAGVSVVGLSDAAAYLDGADRSFTLGIRTISNSDALNAAINRSVGTVELLKKLSGCILYDLQLTDASNIAIEKLGKQALTVVLPVPEELSQSMLTVLTVDRNGQLEQVSSERIRVADREYIRFSTYHLSPYGVYAYGQLEDGGLITEKTDLLAAAMPFDAMPDAVYRNAWDAVMQRLSWKAPVAAVCFLFGLIFLLFAKPIAKLLR